MEDYLWIRLVLHDLLRRLKEETSGLSVARGFTKCSRAGFSTKLHEGVDGHSNVHIIAFRGQAGRTPPADIILGLR